MSGTALNRVSLVCKLEMRPTEGRQRKKEAAPEVSSGRVCEGFHLCALECAQLGPMASNRTAVTRGEGAEERKNFSDEPLGFAVVQSVELRRITRERDRADRISEFMTKMFKVPDPSQARGNAVTAHQSVSNNCSNVRTVRAKDSVVAYPAHDETRAAVHLIA